MHTKPHAIITASDARCGDFLVTHWLGSLRENVDLERADVGVRDFGLTARQRSALGGVRVVPARCEGKAKVSRYAETTRFLEKHDYDQVLAVDCGDLIFELSERCHGGLGLHPRRHQHRLDLAVEFGRGLTGLDGVGHHKHLDPLLPLCGALISVVHV